MKKMNVKKDAPNSVDFSMAPLALRRMNSKKDAFPIIREPGSPRSLYEQFQGSSGLILIAGLAVAAVLAALFL